MEQIQKISKKIPIWNSLKMYKPDDIVYFNEDSKTYQNVTGLNSSPALNNGDWKQINLGDVDTSQLLKKPTEVGSTTDFPFVVLVDEDGESSKANAGDLGKNFANTDLVVSQNRTHSGSGSVNFQMPLILSNSSLTFSRIQNKSSDVSFDRLLLMNGSGSVAYADQIGNILESGLVNTSREQVLRIAQYFNGGSGSAGAISVNLISPPVLMNLVSENTYVVLRGANLLLNAVSMGIEILDSSSDVVAVIPNNQIQLNNNGTELVFYYNFSNIPIGTYRFRIYSGVKVYVTTLELRIVSSVENIDINNMTWSIVRAESLEPEKAIIEYSGGTLVSKNTTANKNDSSNIAFTVKSSKIFNIGEDFLIELSVDFNYGQQNTANTFQTRLGVGYDSDLVNSYKQLSYMSFQRNNHASVGISLNGVSVASERLPFKDNLTFIKQGNLLTTISGTGVVRTMTISNNSDYCLWLSSIYRATSETINIDVLKAFKFN